MSPYVRIHHHARALAYLSLSDQIHTDDSKLLAGAPIGLQIVGPKYSDAQLLHDVETLDAVFRS